MHRSTAIRLLLVAALAAPWIACKEEGRAERAGRKFDEAIEKLQHGDEGALERAGRKIDEAFEEAVEEAEQAVDEMREEAAESVAGDR